MQALEQFEIDIVRVLNLNFSDLLPESTCLFVWWWFGINLFSLLKFELIITNFDIYLFTVVGVIIFLYLADSKGRLYTSFYGGLRIFVNDLYKWQLSMFLQQLSNWHALQYFPLILLISSLILLCNIIGLFPYGFTVTSHITMTLIISLNIFLGFIIIGFLNNGYRFFKLFIPSNIKNTFLLIFVVIIEILSYVIRPLSLAIRLFANMLAGHTLLFILSGFVVSISQQIPLLIIVPLTVVLALFILEVAIAFIQAYVFTILLLLYFNDVYTSDIH